MKILVLLEVFLLFSQDSAAIFLPNNLPFFGTDGDDRVRANRFDRSYSLWSGIVSAVDRGKRQQGWRDLVLDHSMKSLRIILIQ